MYIYIYIERERERERDRERDRDRESLFGRFRRRVKDNIKIDVKEIGWEDVECIHLAQLTDNWRADVNKR